MVDFVEMTAAEFDLGVLRRLSEKNYRWIESAGFDFAFFILSPLLVLPAVLAVIFRVPHAMTVGLLLAFPHYFSSATFYFWDERREYHKSRWMAFYAGPLIVAACYILLVYYRIPLIVQFVLFFWNTFHVARQNCGILSIYRHRAGISDRLQRDAPNLAILATSAWLALWNISTHHEVYPLLLRVHPKFPQFVWAVAGALALFAVGRLAYALWKRYRDGQRLGLPEGAFLATSLLLFYPYLIISDSATATFCMLLPHYVQYLGIVWMLHRRKFREVQGSAPQQTLARLSTNLKLLVPALASIGIVFWAAASLSRRTGYFDQFEIVYLFVAFEHFYLDGIFWALKRREIRDSLVPYLMRGSISEQAA